MTEQVPLAGQRAKSGCRKEGRRGEVECQVGGEGTEAGWGQAGWGLDVFTATAVLQRNLKHSTMTSLSALPEPHPQPGPSATPWNLLAVIAGLEVKHVNHSVQINQSEGD